MLTMERYAQLGLTSIAEKVLAGVRLSIEDGEQLFACPDINALGALAHAVRTRLHGKKTYYGISCQIHHTNICKFSCPFCVFHQKVGRKEEFCLSPAEVAQTIIDKSTRCSCVRVTGCSHPNLTIEWYEELMRAISVARPDIPLYALTISELAQVAKVSNISTKEVLQRLQAAGLRVIASMDNEFFAEPIRNIICPDKISTKEWLAITQEAHELGIFSHSIMEFGQVENFHDRLVHLDVLRRQQDVSHGFDCIIPIPMLPQMHEVALKGYHPAECELQGIDRLRTLAISRLMLDNIPHIKAHWNVLGVKAAQTALFFGADTLNGLERSRAGHALADSTSQEFCLNDYPLSLQGMKYMIEQSGLTPVLASLENEPTAKTGTVAYHLNNPASVQPHAGLFEESADIRAIAESVLEGKRLGPDKAIRLFEQAQLSTLGFLAQAVCKRLHPRGTVSFNIDRNISCVASDKNPLAYLHAYSDEAVFAALQNSMQTQIDQAIAEGGTQILLQSGYNKAQPLDFYEDILRWLKELYPDLHIHGFPPAVITLLAKQEGYTIADVIGRLRAAGLDSIPGGGGEFLSEEVKTRLAISQYSESRWFDVMEEAHYQNLYSIAVMLFAGAGDANMHNIMEHLFAVRELQDRTSGFTAFSPWTFQPELLNLRSHILPAPAYLRILAISRIVLDNISNIRASWLSTGPHLAQLALSFGANDFGSLMLHETIQTVSGEKFTMTREKLERIITTAGYKPRQCTLDYASV